MKLKSMVLAFLLGFSLVALLGAQEQQTGAIKGRVIDAEGAPLPGVAITLTGPSLLGSLSAISDREGEFRIAFVPPGSDYVLRAELGGFNTVIRKGLIIHLGMTISIEIEMSPAPVSEEIEVVAPSPVVDTVRSKTTQIVTTEALRRLPIARSTTAIIQLAPGTISQSVHGSGRGEAGFVFDGVQMVEPDVGGAYMDNVAWDSIEEVELVRVGSTAEVYNTIGGYVNVVTKSGSNKFSGSAQIYYTNENLTQILLPEEELDTLGISKPSVSVYDIDTGASLSGPILRDKIWFVTEAKYFRRKFTGDFKPTTILGKKYEAYDRERPGWAFYGKLSFRLLNNLRFFAMGHYSIEDVPHYYGGWWRTAEANKHNKPIRFNWSTNLSWIVNPDTILDLRVGGLYFKWTGTNSPEAKPGPYFIDAYTGYEWGNSNLEEFTYKPKFYASLNLTHFRRDLLGGDHEIKAGVEIERNRGDWGFYRQDPMFWYYYNGNPYYYRGLYGLSGPHPNYGDGLLEFYAIGDEEGESSEIGKTFRFGTFIQDSFSIKRLTLNLGLRLDTLRAWSPGRTKGAAGTDLAIAIGETYFKPLYGFNPYDELAYETWDHAFPYGIFLSPHIGITYDLFGNGRTAFKATYARQQEGFLTAHFSASYPLTIYSFNFRWWDLNKNQTPDLPGIDKYEHFGASPLPMLSDAYKNSVDPEVKVPYEHEISLSLEHELFTDFSVSARYIYKNRKRMLASVPYDLSTGRYWYTADQAPDWWIPFTTTIPEYGQFPAKTVTMYFQSKDAPPSFNRLTNIPEAKMRYHGFELSFNKRMSNGWQLGGSVVFTNQKGNYPISYHSWASLWVFRTPNWTVNRYGHLPYSRPVMVKLFGTFTLPYRFLVSFFLTHYDGSPWGRTITVVPPEGWAAANNVRNWSYSIQVEPPGTRRNPATDNVDLRVEKEFVLGERGTLGVFVDVFNLFGRTQIYTADNPGGVWRPIDNNTDQGTYSPGWTGITGHSGTRVVKFSIRFKF